MFKRFFASFICFTFIFANLQPVPAQDFNINQLPVPGNMISTTPAYEPLTLKGLIIHPENTFKFDFLMDTGQSNLKNKDLSCESLKIMKYFLTALTIPEDDLWVNLSPYEKGRIVQDNFGQTIMGRDLLAQDYVLKQLTASLIYPEKSLGKKFWGQVYSRAAKEFGTTQVPVNTFNKVWIVPSQAVVWEHDSEVIIVKSHLKVMLEEDYLAMQKHALASPRQDTHSIGANIVRQIILPVLENEVNEGKNFAQLRQMYQAMILATWYKKALKESVLTKVYADQKKTKGIDDVREGDVELIYQQYLKAFKKGAFNYVKEDIDPATGQTVPRKYFSGGFSLDGAMAVNGTSFAKTVLTILTGSFLTLSVVQQQAIAKTTGEIVLVQGQVGEIGKGVKLSTEDFQKLFAILDKIQADSYPADALNAISTLVQSKDKRAIEPLAKALSRGSWLDDSLNKALEELGADEETILQANIKALSSTDSLHKSRVIAYLARLNDKRAIGPITETLKENFINGANDALEHLGADKEILIQANIKALESDEYSRQISALHKIVQFNDKRAIEPLAKKLGDGVLIKEINDALDQLGADKETLFHANIKAIQSENYRLGKAVSVHYLIRSGDKRAIEPMLELLKAGRDVIEANEVLKQLGADKEEIFQANIKALPDRDAVNFLGNSGDSRAIGPLLVMLNRQFSVEEITQALEKLKADEDLILEGNIKALGNGGTEAVDYLVKLKDKRTIQMIIASADHYLHSAVALDVLKKFGASKEDIFQFYINLLRSVAQQQVALEFLGNSGDKRAIEPIRKLLNREVLYYEVSHYDDIIKTLNKLDAGWWEKKSNSGQWWWIIGAAGIGIAAAGIGGHRYQKYLDDTLDQRNIASLKKRIQTLSGEGKIDELFRLLNNRYRDVRQSAMEALDKLVSDKDRKFHILEKAITNPNGDVVTLAAQRLRKMTDNPNAVSLMVGFDAKIRSLEVALDDAESREDYKKYNSISNELHKYGHTKGRYIYEFVMVKVPEGEFEKEYDSYGLRSEIWVERSPAIYEWRKHTRPDFAMVTGYEAAIISEQLRSDLISSALAQGQIVLRDIKDQGLRRFLQLLNAAHGLSNVIVTGGAVRDIFWDKNINDIDFTVKVNMTDEEKASAQRVGAQASHAMYRQASANLVKLAQVLNIPVEKFFDRSNPPQFDGSTLHYLGPYLIPAKEGRQERIIQGLIADAQSRNVYSSYTAPGLLQMAIGPDGRLYGYQQPLEDALHGQAHLRGDLNNGRNLSLLAIIKWLRLKYEFGLNLVPEDYLLIKKVLVRQANETIPTFEIALVRQAMQELLDEAIDPEIALTELNELGLIQMTGFTPRGNIATLQDILHVLQYRDTIPADIKIDDIVILGNDEFDVFRHALRLWASHKESRIVVLGGKGRLTPSLILKAKEQGLELPDNPTEANIIKRIMEKMISEEPEFTGFNPIFILEDKSTNTVENIANYKQAISSQLNDRDSQNPYQIIFLQTPHQQLRANATVEKVLENEIRDGSIRAFSETPEYSHSQQFPALDVLSEALRLIIYSKTGNNTIADVYVPSGFWQNVVELYNSLPGDQKSRIIPILQELVEGSGVAIESMFQKADTEQRKFLESIQKDFAMLQQNTAALTKDLGGITLNSKIMDLQIKRDVNGEPLLTSQQPLDKINFQGFVPQIIRIQPVDLRTLLGLDSSS